MGGNPKKVSSAIAPGVEQTAPELIDKKIRELNDWRGETLARVRLVIQKAEPDVVEEIKWRKPTNPAGVPVWSHAGVLCTGEIYKDKVKLTFAKGALIDDPTSLFNSSLDGAVRRAIDIAEGVQIDEPALKALIRAAVALNTTGVRSHPEVSSEERRPAADMEPARKTKSKR